MDFPSLDIRTGGTGPNSETLYNVHLDGEIYVFTYEMALLPLDVEVGVVSCGEDFTDKYWRQEADYSRHHFYHQAHHAVAILHRSQK